MKAISIFVRRPWFRTLDRDGRSLPNAPSGYRGLAQSLSKTEEKGGPEPAFNSWGEPLVTGGTTPRSLLERGQRNAEVASLQGVCFVVGILIRGPHNDV